MRRNLSILFLLTLAAAPLSAQLPGGPQSGEELVDRVVAVVGDTVVLLSDLFTDIEQLQAAGQTLPTDPQGQRRLFEELLANKVTDVVVISAARSAGVQVRDEEVAAMVAQDLANVQDRFPSEDAFREALAASGMTLEGYRQTLLVQYRDRAMVQRFLQMRLGAGARPHVSDEEVRAFFATQAGELGPRPTTVSFQQVVIEPRATEAARAAARETAAEVLRELREGASFEVLARRYSMDPGSREQGGELGWFRPGGMVRRFEDAVYSMRPGQVSGIVETEFGFHIIRLDRVRGTERQARHILIIPEVDEAAMESARQRAEAVLAAARAGTTMPELARQHGVPGENLVAEQVPLDRLPEAYAAAVADAQRGDLVGPFVTTGRQGERWVVLRVTERVAEGSYRLEDVHDQIVERLQEEMMLEALVEDLRRRTHISILL
jgi:peptidyl-prolyl cis-trans isomerase SurA